MPTNCLSVFDHFARLALKGLSYRKAVSENIGLGVILYTVITNAVKIHSYKYTGVNQNCMKTKR